LNNSAVNNSAAGTAIKYFGKRKKINRHLESISKINHSGKMAVDRRVPQLNNMLELKIGYMYDITDCMRRQYLKMKRTNL